MFRIEPGRLRAESRNQSEGLVGVLFGLRVLGTARHVSRQWSDVMTISDYVLGVVALVCFVSAAVGWPKSRVNLIALGLACLTAAYLF